MTRLLRAEALKLRSTRTFTALLTALMGIPIPTVVLPVTLAPLDTGRFALSGAFAQSTLLSGGVTTAALLALVLGVLGGAGEYRHGTLTPTLLATPARGRVMAAKALVHAVAGATLGVGTALFCLAVTAGGLSLRGAEFALSTGEVVAAVAGAGGYVGLAAVFSLGVSAALANQAAAITVLFTLVLVIENVLVTVAPSVARWMPGQTGSALGFPTLDRDTSTQSVLGADVLSQALGGVTFAAYALIAVLAGVVALRRRDIT